MEPTETTLVPTRVALIVLAVLLAVTGLLGFGLNGLLRRGDELQRLESAPIEGLRDKVAQNPRDSLLRLSLADALRDAGQPREALTEYETVLRDNPKDVAALFERGEMLLALDQPRDAEAAFWQVLAEDPGHVRASEALGEYYAKKGQFHSLVKAVRPAATLHPTEARLQCLMGLAYENLGQLDWAAARYYLALDAVPDMPEALEGLKRLETRR